MGGVSQVCAPYRKARRLNFIGPGLDHGVFIPFRLMFGEEFTDIPIVQVSIDSSLSTEKNWALGKAMSKLRFAYFRGYHC
jgi:aromatic ring-opening dioxygenase catalytic subunit (LigB family)